jgi:hypothetical protein
LLKLEHGSAAYRADLALYGVLSLCLAATLRLGSPPGSRPALAAWALAGGTLWTLVEYLLHASCCTACRLSAAGMPTTTTAPRR